MSIIRIRIDGDISDILPAGVEINAEIAPSRTNDGITALREAIMFITKEEDEATGRTPAERLLSDRLDAVNKMIINVLTPEQKLSLANKATGT